MTLGLQLSIFNHRNQNKQRCEADFKSALSDPPFMSPLPLFSIIQSHLIGIISALFPVSCLDIWPAALTTTITQRVLLRMYWKSLGRMRAGGGRVADSMTEVRKWMILLLPGKIQQTNPWKIDVVYTRRQNLFFSSLVRNSSKSVLWQKVLNLGFPGRRNIWKVDMENGPFFPFSYHTWFIWDIPGKSCHCCCLCLPTRRPDFRLARRP